MTITIDRAQVLLEQIAETLPAELYKDLNGGILLLPQEKISPYAAVSYTHLSPPAIRSTTT